MWSPRQERFLNAGTAITILVLAIRLSWDHALWVSLDHSPLLDEDSAFHAVRIAKDYYWFIADPFSWFREIPSFSLPSPSGNYPPVVSWVTWLGFACFGLKGEVFRSSQVIFTFLLSVGSGILAWRAWGRASGIASAGMAVVYPLLWLQRSTIMLMAPLAGTSALAYATIPLANGQRNRVWSLLGGVAFGLASLTHVSFVYFGVPLSVFVVLRAGWCARDPQVRRPVLQETATWIGAASITAGIWWFPNLPMITGVVGNHWNVYRDTPTIWGRAYFLVRLKELYLAGPQLWAVLAGFFLCFLLARRRPMALGGALVFVAGYLWLQTFPQAHDRYYLPFVSIFSMFAVAPLGVLSLEGPGRRIREGVAILLATGVVWWGLSFSAAAFGAAAPPLRGYAEIPEGLSLMHVHPPQATEQQLREGDALVRRALLQPPQNPIRSAPRPNREVLPFGALAEMVVKDLQEVPRSERTQPVYMVQSDFPVEGVIVEVALRGRFELMSGYRIGNQEFPCALPPCYAISDPQSAPSSQRLTLAGFETLGEVPYSGRLGSQTLRLWRIPKR